MHQVERVRVLETATLQRHWLLHDVLPSILENLQLRLNQCLGMLSQQQQAKTDALPLSSGQNESIKGLLTLNGPYITKAELQVRLPNYHQDTPVKIKITAPIFLEQAQQGANYIALAAERMQQTTDASAKLQTPALKEAAVELFEDVCQYVQRALSAFEYPGEASLFPCKVCHPKYFEPPLSEDLVIEFCIHEIHVVCNIYALEFKPGKPTDVHQVVLYKDKHAQVMDQSHTRTQSPMLTDLKMLLQSVREVCQSYRQMLLEIDA
ncbi:Rogdi leucine zipper containing protein-domain-containing protein [Syncephalastrum racemosum]|uniref:Rogdi leucine zipper containing protein-domain-containing protein n=1 Tax=Syncephalastrum racemosum TaxID=13706 RepID=A0A1X2HBZ4_SYNRA|nr:Rogdi leucine zipper containing protein-domain-containing protein [Syncephalastrum racemosum]